jgi:ClpX C4-type zinc finger
MALTGQANTDREYMRRRRAKLAQAVGLGSQLKRLLPDDERATAPEQDQELIERLTQVTRERDRALQELELARRAVQLKPVGPDLPSRCSVCLKRRDEVKAMFTNPRPHNQFFVCNECISEMHHRCNEIIARETSP